MIAYAVALWLPTVIDDLTVDEEGADGNVFVDWMPSTPDVAVAVMSGPGDEQGTLAPVDLPVVQLLVRGAPEDRVGSFDLAYECYSQLCCLDQVVLDDGGDHETRVITCTPVQSHPVPLGQDPNQRYEWSLNFRLRTFAPTTHRPAVPA